MAVDGLMTGALPPELAHEAVRLFLMMMRNLHAVTSNAAGEVLFAMHASPQLADDLSAFGASVEDDEPDGTAELDGRRLQAFREALLSPAPRQGHPVPSWTPPPVTVPSQARPLSEAVLERWSKLYGVELAGARSEPLTTA